MTSMPGHSSLLGNRMPSTILTFLPISGASPFVEPACARLLPQKCGW